MKQTILWKQQGPVVIFVNITLYNGFKLMREQEGGGGRGIRRTPDGLAGVGNHAQANSKQAAQGGGG